MKKFRMVFVFMVFVALAFADDSGSLQNIYDPNYTPPPGQGQPIESIPAPPAQNVFNAPGQYVPQNFSKPLPKPTYAATPAAQATPSQNMSDQNQYAVVVTARRIPEIIDFVPRNFDIIESKDINALLPVADILEGLQGVMINRNGGFEGVSTLSLDGMPSEAALILLNGVPINDIGVGSADLTTLDASGIEKIEIIKGGVSSIYGADAMGGVVNILTDPEIKKLLTAGAYYGSYNTQKQTLSSCYQIANIKYAVNAVQESSDGYETNSGYFKRTIDGKIKFNTDTSDTSVFGYYMNREQGVPGEVDFQTPDDKQYDENYNAGLDETLNLSFIDLKLSGFLKSGEMQYISPSYGDSIDKQKEYQASATGIYNEGGYLSIIGGYEYNQKNFNSSSTNTQAEYNNALLANATLKVIKPLVVSGGARIDMNSAYGNLTSYNAGAKFDLDVNTQIYASLEDSYRAPTFDELYWNSAYWMGNPDLKPETALSYEFGIKRSDNIFIESFDWFSREIDNMINDYALDPNNPNAEEPQNIEKARILGFEGKAAIKFNDNDLLQAGYTFMNAMNATAGTTLPYVPESKLNARIEKGLPFSMKLDIDYEYVDSRITGGGSMIKPYSMLNAGLNQKLSENIDVSVQLNNILNNTTYNTYSSYGVESGYIMPGRTVMAGGKLAF